MPSTSFDRRRFRFRLLFRLDIAEILNDFIQGLLQSASVADLAAR